MSTGRQKGRMPEKDYQKIRANYTYLVENFKDPVKLAIKLFEKNIFDEDEKDEVKKIYMTAAKGRSTAADQLLTYVLSNCGNAYRKFIQCLEELGYRDVVNVLENTTNGKNKINLMTEQDKTRHQLEELQKNHDLAKQELENMKKQMETLKKRQDGDSKQLLKKIKKREHELETYKKQTEEKEALTKKRIDELETCIKTLTLNDEDTIQPQLLHGTLSGNTSHTSHGNLSGNTSHTSHGNLSGNTSHTSHGNLSGNTNDTSDDTLSDNTSDTSDEEDTRKQQQQQQLFKACQHGTLDDIKNMVNIDVNVRGGFWDETPLFRCCMSSVSPVDKIKYLVSHGADINARDSHNNTILHWACLHGTLSTVQYLVDCLHLDLHVKSKDGKTPLDYCRRSHIESRGKIKYIKAKSSLFRYFFRR